MWKNLRSDTVRDGALAGFVLKQAKALKGDVIELFASFDYEVNRYQQEQQEAARNRN